MNLRLVWAGRDHIDPPVPPPALGRDPFHQPGVLPAPSWTLLGRGQPQLLWAAGASPAIIISTSSLKR